MQVPRSRSPEFPHDYETASAVLRSALASGRTMLSEVEAKSVLTAYRIPVVPTRTAATIEQRVHNAQPEAVLEGFTIQPMVTRPNAFEPIVGLAADPVFGPVVLFGHGGTATEVTADRVWQRPRSSQRRRISPRPAS